ncbi:hypothetical protein EDD18DRAFT_1210764 [Armillaria luteobubalina]|uniref:Uncharacterized protein n=1 Tax=Armillaria luteobubalina TaxID=153913 RepID=A0AA39UG56_9AGAR|nr:hypothetical protein EDD18DRAFT_1210764 [Armillaria luteobubalina]
MSLAHRIVTDIHTTVLTLLLIQNTTGSSDQNSLFVAKLALVPDNQLHHPYISPGSSTVDFLASVLGSVDQPTCLPRRSRHTGQRCFSLKRWISALVCSIQTLDRSSQNSSLPSTSDVFVHKNQTHYPKIPKQCALPIIA